MSDVLNELVELLSLEKIEANLFRGQSQDLGWGTVYGGQVLGQALSAAVQTVPEDRSVHSLHAYFLRPGDVSLPIVYDVDRIRDGRSFTTRRVVAIQKGKPIFNLSASFQITESGFSHQSAAPEATDPEELLTEQERVQKFYDRVPKFLKERALVERPFEIRAVDPTDDPIAPSATEPVSQHWLKTTGPLRDSPALHQFLLAYASDFSFLTTSMRPHGVSWLTPGIQVASVDHAMWFHRPFRVDQWLLHSVESTSASGARGYVRGQIFDQKGNLVASTSQEGLIRRRTQRP